jgi:hypothetical protein
MVITLKGTLMLVDIDEKRMQLQLGRRVLLPACLPSIG